MGNRFELIAVKPLAAASLFLLTTHFAYAAEMDHSQHMQGSSDTSMNHDMAGHGNEDMAASVHMHHGHGAGGWMFRYRFMRMNMKGLLDGTDDVDSRDISGVSMDMMGNRSLTPGRDYMMAPT